MGEGYELDDKGAYADSFDVGFQEHVLAVMVNDPSLVIQYRTVLSGDYFQTASHEKIAGALLAYVDKYQSMPTDSTLRQWVKDRVKADEYAICCDTLDDLATHDFRDAEAVRERIIEFGKNAAMCNAVMQGANLLAQGNRNVLPPIQEAMLVGEDLLNLGLDYKKITEDRFALDSEIRQVIPTGMPHLDRMIGGGLGRNELGVVLAPPKRGKTTLLVNIGYGAMLAGYNVLHYTLEMHERKVCSRYDARLSLRDFVLRERNPEAYREMMTKRIEEIPGGLMIQTYQTRKATVSRLRAHLMLLRANGFVPDIVIADYADIMAPERRMGETRHEQAGIYEDLRALGGEFDMAIWTASQGNRNSVEKEWLDMTDFGESFEKAAILDIGIGACQTPTEYTEGTMRLVPVGMREAPEGFYVDCRIDRKLCHVETESIRDIAFRQEVPVDADEEIRTTAATMRSRIASTKKSVKKPGYKYAKKPGAPKTSAVKKPSRERDVPTKKVKKPNA